MTQAIVAARAILRGWRHEVIRTLGGSVWAYRCVNAALVLTALGWVLLAASARNAVGAEQMTGPGLQVLLLKTTLNLAVALSALVTVGLMVLVPEQTAFSTLLSTLPLRPVYRLLALDTTTLAFGLGAGVLVSGPFIWLSVRSLDGAATQVAVVACWLLLAVAGVLIGSGLVRAAGLLIRLTVRLPDAVARALGALVVSALIAQQCLVTQVVSRQPSLTQRLLEPLARAAVDQPWSAAVVAAGAALFGALVWRLAAAVAGRPWRVGSSRLTGPFGRSTGTRPRTLTTLELTQLVRHPANVSTLVLLLGIAIAVVASPDVRGALLWPGGGILLLGIASLMPVGSYGATFTHHWLYRCASARAGVWVRPKWTASALVWAGSIAVLAALYSLTPDWRVQFMLGLLPQLFIALVVSLLVGLIVPVSDEQPLSSVAAVVLAGMAGIGVSMLADRLSGDSFLVVVGYAVAFAVACFLGYRRLATWRERDLVF